ncbi:MAG: DUF2798 domain-containing protein [Rhodobacterales bacterium]|nr:DUF2798 domain-containing protein [Rhodobacterales bacterium]
MPARLAPAMFGFILSGFMSFAVSGIAMLRNAGLVDGFFELWVNAWLPSWAFAFPVVLVVAPITRRLVGMMVKAPRASAR